MLANHARDIYQAALLRAFDILVEGLRTVERPSEVHLEDAVPVFPGHLIESLVDSHAGIVDQYIDRSELVVNVVRRRPDIGSIPDICLCRERTAILGSISSVTSCAAAAEEQ